MRETHASRGPPQHAYHSVISPQSICRDNTCTFCTTSDLKPPQTSTWSKYSPRRPRTASLCWGTAGNRTAAVHLVLGRLGRHGLEEGPVVCAACRLLRAGGFVDHGGMKLRKASDNIWRRMSEPVGKGNGGAPWQYREAIFGRSARVARKSSGRTRGVTVKALQYARPFLC